MPKMQQMHAAIEQWLAARANLYTGAKDGADAYCAADTRLLASFAVDWVPDDPRMFGTAYQHFRAALVTVPPVITD
jgi:hypothetical protein